MKLSEITGKCPYCGKEHLEYGNSEIEGNTFWYEITCGECGKEFQEVYTLVPQGIFSVGE